MATPGQTAATVHTATLNYSTGSIPITVCWGHMQLKTAKRRGPIFYDFREPWLAKRAQTPILGTLANLKKCQNGGQSKIYFFENGGKARFLVGDRLETM